VVEGFQEEKRKNPAEIREGGQTRKKRKKRRGSLFGELDTGRNPRGVSGGLSGKDGKILSVALRQRNVREKAFQTRKRECSVFRTRNRGKKAVNGKKQRGEESVPY